MRWPSFADYEFFVKAAFDYSVLDPMLKNGEPMGGISGGFSRVYPVKIASQTFALRCWVKDVHDAKNRYEQISDYLNQVSLPYFVDFEYVPKGILIGDTKYPITRMEWAEGVSLREFISQNSQHPHLFRVVADEFQKMVATLHKYQIAHGDLQDGNILLKRNGADVEIKLIDYDSLFVPALQGRPEQIVGLPEYQHPQRMTGRGQTNEKVDYFSELVIYLSFFALSEKPELWNRFKDKTERGLLFSKADFENPNQSDIFTELEKLSPDIQKLAATLKDFCAETSIDQLKPLEAVLPKPDPKTHSDQGSVFFNNKRYDEALAEFQKALSINPKYKIAHHGIGLVYLHREKYTDAINAFKRAITQDANYKEAYHGLGLAYFKSGDNSKATAAVNAALKIDSHYQPARQLLDTIKAATSPPISTSGKPAPKPPPPTSTPGTSQSPATNPASDVWQHVNGLLRSRWHLFVTGTLGIAFTICFIAFLTQINAKDAVLSQNAGLKKQLAQTESKNRRLNFSVQDLEGDKKTLNRKIGELQKQLRNQTSWLETRGNDVLSLHEQLSSYESENQDLKNQLHRKNTELRAQASVVQQLRKEKSEVLGEDEQLRNSLASRNLKISDQSATIRQLQREKASTRTENRRLQEQLVEKISEVRNSNNRNQQLQNEKTEIQRQNQRLQSEKAKLIRQNQNLRNENSDLRDQLNETNQEDTHKASGPEPPKKMKIRDYRNVVTRAISHNNQGCLDFERGNYDEAVQQFEQSIRADSQFSIAHYNLGCAYLQMKEYNDAVGAFDRAIALDQKFKEAYYNRSLTYFKTSRFQKAKQDATNALNIDPNYQLVRRLLTAIENHQQ